MTQLLVKGKGVFSSAAAAGEPPRLRLLYEAIPMAYLIEKVSLSVRTYVRMHVLDEAIPTACLIGTYDGAPRPQPARSPPPHPHPHP